MGDELSNIDTNNLVSQSKRCFQSASAVGDLFSTHLSSSKVLQFLKDDENGSPTAEPFD